MQRVPGAVPGVLGVPAPCEPPAETTNQCPALPCGSRGDWGFRSFSSARSQVFSVPPCSPHACSAGADRSPSSRHTMCPARGSTSPKQGAAGTCWQQELGDAEPWLSSLPLCKQHRKRNPPRPKWEEQLSFLFLRCYQDSRKVRLRSAFLRCPMRPRCPRAYLRASRSSSSSATAS